MIGINHLSHSQVTTFLMCPRRWWYDKQAQAPKERTAAALVFGSAVHDAIAGIHEASLMGLPCDRTSLFTSCWKQQVQATAETPICYGKDDASDLHAKGQQLIATYQPPPGICGVEQPFEIELSEDLPPIVGRIDLIRADQQGQLVLADVKTCSSRMLSETASVEAQLGLYDQAYPAVAHEVIVLGKQKAPTITIQPVTPWPVTRLRQHYQEVCQAMQAGIRYANPGWQCETCPFYNRCQADGR